MKKILLLQLVTFILMAKTFSQNVEDRPLQKGNCFLAAKAEVRANVSPTSRTMCVGDKIAIKLKDNEIIRSKISKLSQGHITTTNGHEIDVAQIKWIKRTKLTTGSAIVGGVLIAGGIALFVPVAEGEVNFDQIVPRGGFALLVFTSGILILTKHPKFKPGKGDKLIFNDQTALNSL